MRHSLPRATGRDCVAVAGRPYDDSRWPSALVLWCPRASLRAGGRARQLARTPTTKLGGFIALTKPRIIELLLITTVPTMVLAEQGWPATSLVLITLLGGTLAAGGANAINMVVDRDIDALMTRTQGRPLVTGLVTPGAALVFALGLEVVAFAVLWWGANLLSAVLALSRDAVLRVRLHDLAEAHEQAQHRHRRRRRRGAGARRMVRRHATTSPGRPSCCSPSSSCGRRRTSGRSRSVTPTTTAPPTCRCCRRSSPSTSRPARWSPTPRSLVASTLVLIPVADTGWIYGVAAVVLGGLFLWGTIDLGRNPTPQRSMRVFGYSITTSPCCSAP